MHPSISKQKTIVMKTKNLFLAFASLLIVFALSFSSCTKTGVNNGEAIQVYLTDGPGDFEAVNLDIVKVEVKLDTDEKHEKDDRFGDNDDDKDDHTKKKDDYGREMILPVPLDAFSPDYGLRVRDYIRTVSGICDLSEREVLDNIL
jgi:hypothetical protein